MLQNKMISRSSMAIQILFFVIFVTIALLIVLDSSVNFVYNQTGSSEEIISYEDGWKMTDGTNILSLTQDALSKEKSVRIENTVPSNISDNSALSIQTAAQTVFVFIGDEKIYSSEFTLPHNDSGGQYWRFINLSDAHAGKTISIDLKSENSADCTNINTVISSIYIGTPRALQSNILSKNIFVIILFLVCFILGIIIAVFSVLMGAKSKNFDMLSMTSLSTFLIITGIWIIFDSVIPQFFIANLLIIRYISFASFMLIPVPFLQYTKTLLSVQYLWFDILSIFVLTNALASIFLHIFNILPLPATLISTHVLMLISFITAMVGLYREIIERKNNHVLIPFIAVLCLGIGGVISISFYYSDSSNIKNVSSAFIIAFTVFISLLVIHSIGIVSSEFKNSAKIAVYKQLAITDVMTGLYNRAAFDEEMAVLECELQDYSKIAFVIFDINDLKKCNDSCGHHIGDRIIRASANCIMNAFQSETKRYRIGGDEFAVILLDGFVDDMNICLEKFNDELEHYNSIHSHKLSIAFGTSLYDKETSPDEILTIKALFKAADKNMYQNKAAKKELST